MIATILRWIVLAACTLVAGSFAFFVVDQAGAASDNSVSRVTGKEGTKVERNTNIPDPDPATERQRERENDDIHEYLDDANDVLTGPFTGIIDSNNIWVQRGVPTLIALLLYGGLGLTIARAAFMRRL